MIWLIKLKSMTAHKSCITKIDVKSTDVTASYINTKMTELYASIYQLQELKNKTLIMMMIHE
jgi:transposase